MITPTRADPVRMRPLASSTTVNMSGYASLGDRGAGYTLIRGGAGGPGATRNNSGSWKLPPIVGPKNVTFFGRQDGWWDRRHRRGSDGNRRCRDVGAGGQVTISGDRIGISGVTLPSTLTPAKRTLGSKIFQAMAVSWRKSTWRVRWRLCTSNIRLSGRGERDGRLCYQVGRQSHRCVRIIKRQQRGH